MLDRRLSILVLLPLIVALGCGLTGTQQKAARGFARASAEIGDLTANELARMRIATVEMNEANLALGGTAKKNDLDKAFKPDRITARVSAARALSKYGVLLLSLVETSQKKELEEASEKFSSSFRSAATNVAGMNMSDGQLEALAKLVAEVGGLIVEHKRAKAVKRIVKDAKDDVDAICQFLIDDLSTDAGHLGQNFGSTISRLRNDADPALSSADFAQRAAAASALKRAHLEEDYLNGVAKKMRAALGQLKKANAELVEALDKKLSLKEIAAAGKELSELGDAVVALSSE